MSDLGFAIVVVLSVLLGVFLCLMAWDVLEERRARRRRGGL